MTSRLSALGSHEIRIAASENSDCVRLASSLRECFERAGWKIVPGAMTGTWDSLGPSGLALFGTNPKLTATLFQVLLVPPKITKVHAIQFDDSFSYDIGLRVGPKID